MSKADTFERLRLVHRLDQQFAEHAHQPKDADEFGLCIPDIDNDENTRLLYRARQVETSLTTPPKMDFVSDIQESRVADVICQLAMFYETIDPDEFMILPTTQFDTYTQRFTIDAVHVVLGSARGITLRHANDVMRFRHTIDSVDTIHGATSERVYQMYATNPIDTFIGPTILSGERRGKDSIPVMQYTNEGVLIAQAGFVDSSVEPLSFRPSIVVGPDGKYF